METFGDVHNKHRWNLNRPAYPLLAQHLMELIKLVAHRFVLLELLLNTLIDLIGLPYTQVEMLALNSKCRALLIDLYLFL
jgi:hypothetical protein